MTTRPSKVWPHLAAVSCLTSSLSASPSLASTRTLPINVHAHSVMRDDTILELQSRFESEEEEIRMGPCTESTPVENSDSLIGAHISLFSPLVAKYKEMIDTIDRELALHEEKEAQKKYDPKIISRNQEMEDHKKTLQKHHEKYHSSDYHEMKLMKQAKDHVKKREMRSKFTIPVELMKKKNKKKSLRIERKNEAKLIMNCFPLISPSSLWNGRRDPPRTHKRCKTMVLT